MKGPEFRIGDALYVVERVFSEKRKLAELIREHVEVKAAEEKEGKHA